MAKNPTGPKDTAAEVAKIVARKMPGWQVVTPAQDMAYVAGDTAAREAGMKVDSGPSIAQLRKKFGVDVADSADAGLEDLNPSIETVQIRPENGGAAKTADIDITTGDVKIVQG